MAFEVEVNLNGSHTVHYGSVEAYRKDIQARENRIRALSNFAKAAGIASPRGQQLQAMAMAERSALAQLQHAALESFRNHYANA